MLEMKLPQAIELLPKVQAFLEETKGLYINGEFIQSKAGKTFDTINPSTGDKITDVYEAQAEDIDAAVGAARDAFDHGSWSKLDAAQRALLMLKLADLMEEHKMEIAQIDALDNGKPINEVLGNDIPNAVEQFRYFAGWATKNMGQVLPVAGNFLNYTRHEPVGVVGQIIPWNFPFMMVSWKIAPALATGCTVVLKPAEQTPLSALYFAQLVSEAGFPPGVINIVPGFGPIAGEALVIHEKVDKIAFTGSTDVGKGIMKKAADTMKRVTLELGGKSPNIILQDADLSTAIPGVLSGIMANQGEVCSAGSRVFVHRSQSEEIIKQMVSYASKIQQGHALNFATQMGALVSEKQLNRVKNYIEIGVEEGATLACGGKSTDNGYFMEPTIFTNVSDTMTIAQEEIFGPVVVVLEYDSLDELVERANKSNFGLAAGIWTQNLKNAHSLAAKLNAGSVWVNCYNMTDPASPFGGYKQSGIGREMGSYALQNYTEVKSVWINLD